MWLAHPDAVVSSPYGLAGFAELYTDGCDTSPAAYLEGWYVEPQARQSGIGAALVRVGEVWARLP